MNDPFNISSSDQKYNNKGVKKIEENFAKHSRTQSNGARIRSSSRPISENFTGTKFWGKKCWSNSNFRGSSRTTTSSDTTSGNGKVAGTAALPRFVCRFWYLVFIRKVFQLHANATTRRNGHERGCSSLPRIRVFLTFPPLSPSQSRVHWQYLLFREGNRGLEREGETSLAYFSQD